MNSINPAVPPKLTGPMSHMELVPLGSNPEERESIPNLLVAIEALLRQPRRIMLQLRQPGGGRLVGAMIFGMLAFSLVYGLVVGSFAMGTQLWAAPVKIACGLLVTGLICLPSLYIFACISGSRASLLELCGLVAGLLLLMTTLLVGFAPVAWLFSQSTESITWMGTLHLSFWLIATCFGLRFLSQGFAHGQARSTAGLKTWIFLFVLVAVQMTTALRPILGKSDSFLPTQKKFFINHWADCLKSGSLAKSQ